GNAVGGGRASTVTDRAANTKGMGAGPMVNGGRGSGGSTTSEASATSPDSIAQNAGTRTSGATRIARHLRCGGSGVRPAGGPDRRARRADGRVDRPARAPLTP